MKESITPLVAEAAKLRVRCRANPPQRILVVADDFETREIGSSVLRHSGFEVDAAGDGAVAWQALNTGHYDLLITDYKMPRMSGVELLMKVHAAHMALPVIMTAAVLPRDQFTRYPWLKPAAMLQQPCTVVDLVGTVNQVLWTTEVARQQIAPTPIRQSQATIQWLAELMFLLRSPVFR
jgi:DNA-binding response OmpR family regulator